jgi:hypothetical protein
MSMKYLGNISVGSVVIDLTPIKLSSIRQILEKKWDHNGIVHHVFIIFREV